MKPSNNIYVKMSIRVKGQQEKALRLNYVIYQKNDMNILNFVE